PDPLRDLRGRPRLRAGPQVHGGAAARTPRDLGARRAGRVNTRAVFDQVFTMEAAIAGGVFAAVALLIAFAVLRYRDRPGREPSRRSKANVLEACFALALLGFSIRLTVDTAAANSRETAAAP